MSPQGLTLAGLDKLRDMIKLTSPYIVFAPTMELHTSHWVKRAILRTRWLWYKYIRRWDILGFYAGKPIFKSETIVELGEEAKLEV